MIPDTRPSDAILAAAARNGDSRAFAELMRRHKGWVYRFIRSYVGEREDAHDLLQDCFISAWRALPRFDVDRPFTGWLRRIALNKCRDHSRRKVVRRAALKLLGQMQGSTREMAADDLVELGDTLRQLEIEIAQLPRSLKEPLILTAFEGLSHKDAANLLNLTVKAIEVRIYRAKRHLAERLNPDSITVVSRLTETGPFESRSPLVAVE